jgi:hypothetical protein
MDVVLIDYLIVLFALVFYAFGSAVYLIRARGLSKLELTLSPLFSIQLIPFFALWVLNLGFGNDSGRLLAGLPIIAYLVYDFWYRLIRKTSIHHPKLWLPGLVIYLLLLFLGSIGLIWYGYLMSNFYGNMLVIAFSIMMSSFGYHQFHTTKKGRGRE